MPATNGRNTVTSFGNVHYRIAPTNLVKNCLNEQPSHFRLPNDKSLSLLKSSNVVERLYSKKQSSECNKNSNLRLSSEKQHEQELNDSTTLNVLR